MTGWPNAAEDRLLRNIAPPPLSAGFADQVMAALPSGDALPPARTGRDRRGGWSRRKSYLLGGLAAGLLSVGAAASGLLGGRIQNLPVIATIAEAVAPVAPKPAKPKVRLAEMPKPLAPATVAPPIAAAPVADLPVTRRELQREVIAQRIADRIERRQARRAELGLPPGDPAMRRALRQRLQQVPPAERAALVERVRAIRQERAGADGVTAAPAPETFAERRAARFAQLTPEQREALRERRRIVRERRAERVERVERAEPADSVPEPARE